MNNLTLYLGGIAVLSLFVLGACKSDGINCSSSFQFQQELSDEAQEWANAAQAYGQNPTTENCEAYKAAARDYLDEAKKYKDCAYQQGQGQEYEDGIEDAEQSIDDLDCT